MTDTRELQALVARLKEEGDRLAEAQRIAHIGSWELDLDSGQVICSEELHNIYGTNAATFPMNRQAFTDLVHPDDRATVLEALEKSGSEGSTLTHRIVTPKGTVKVVEQRWRFVRSADHSATCALGTCQDISERHAAAADLQNLAERYVGTLESISDGFYTIDRQERFTYVNAAAERIFGLGRDALMGRNIWDIFAPSVRMGSFGRQMARALATQVPSSEEVALYPDTWFDVRVYPSASGLSVYFRDVTERRESTDALRAFALRVETMQASERAAIARDVHDAVGQGLTVLRMDTSRLGHLSSANSESSVILAGMKTVIDETLTRVRSIAWALHPSALDDLGLAAAVELHAQHVARSADLHAVVVAAPELPELPALHAATAYRIIQESLTNVVRHAHATEVTVRLSGSTTELVVEIADNGAGFSPSRLPARESLGLVGMRERATALGGSLRITSGSPRGTTVSLRLPVPAARGHPERAP